MRIKGWLAFPLLTGLLAALTLMQAGCGLAREGIATPTAIPTPLVASKATFVVQRGAVVDELVFSGRFAAEEEEKLFFRVDGRVGKILVRTGDKVKAGDVLAELEISDLLNQVAQARLTLQQAQIKLKSAQDNVGEQKVQLQIALETARLKLEQTRVRYPSLVIAAATRYKAAAAVEAAQAAYDRRGQVSGSPEALNLQRATWDYDIAKAQYEQAVQAQKAWDYDVRMQEQAVLLAESNIRKAALSIDPVLEQDVAKAQLAVDRLNAQVANARLVSTVDGEVTMTAMQVGATIQAFRQAVTIAMPGPLNISADVQKEMLEKLSIGMKTTLTFGSLPGRTFSGTIRRLPYPYGAGGSSTDEDRSTRVSLDDAGVSVERGILANVRVVINQRDDVLWLPPAAVRTFQGRSFVVVQDGDAQKRVSIETGISTEERIEIVDGLSQGQIIIGP